MFGGHCQANLTGFSTDPLHATAALSLHRAGSEGGAHFDLMANVFMDEMNDVRASVLFISFPVNDLQRHLLTGSSDTYSLILGENHALTKEAAYVKVLSAKPGQYELGADAGGNIGVPIIRVSIPNTPWSVLGVLDTAHFMQFRTATIFQTLIGLVALFVAGVTAWRSVEQEKIHHSRTSIIVENVEAERKRIARELHDQVLSDVSHAKRLLMDIEYGLGHVSTANEEKLQRVQGSVDRFSTNIRSAIDDLYPHILDNIGLCAAVERYVDIQESCQFAFHLDLESEVENVLDSTQRLHVYRIIVELINNALMHSDCGNVNLTIGCNVGSVCIVFEDDGCGFDNSLTVTRCRHGLRNIEFRVLLLKGSGVWPGKSPHGTIFELTTPVGTYG